MKSTGSARTREQKSTIILMACALLTCALLVGVGRGERIKDIVDIQGLRNNPLTGIGLVIGLAGTGDSTLPSRQMMTNIFRDAGIILSPSDLTGGNIAVVMVTAELGPFARSGSRIDVDVSAIGDAKSLQGGMLLPTPLEGLDGQVYAVAQGGISIGGWTAAGQTASITKNHQTVGRIPDGAIVEKEEIATFVEYLAGQRFITLNLRNSDFSTSERISKAVNQTYPNSAVVVDAGTIMVKVPSEINQTQIAGFIDDITKEQVTVDMPAAVVINERTGTIVVGENVGISAVAISQGSLVVKIRETARVSQPPAAPFSDAGTTVVVPETIPVVEEKDGYLIPVSRAVTVSELAKALNAIGATPRDLIAIFNALKEAGALQAKLVIM
ncbi:MAG: flagellar basal body P-ring protein FlgI [Phycisphaerae bacterium]